MGRLRIKKKDSVLPFRQTLAYRGIMLAGSVVMFFTGLYILFGALAANNTLAFILSAVIGVGGVFLTFYNFDRLRYARLPERMAKRARQRR